METLAEFCARLSPLPLPEKMRQWDADAAALGFSPPMLMENAGHVALDVILRYLPDLAGKTVWLIMGSGNNGGDAACVARLLADRGAKPLLFTARPPDAATGASALHLSLARANGVRVLPLGELTAAADAMPGGGSAPPRLIVDGLLGTGFSRTLRPAAQTVIEQMNVLSGRIPSCFVLALDIPSGLNATTGKPSPVAVRAHATVSLAAAKPGLVLPEATPWVGALHVGDIGLPAPVRGPVGHYLLDGHALAGLPAPGPESYKNSFGHVLVLGGAPGLSGAGHMAAAAALRAGAGLVSAAAPESALAAIQGGWPEIMTVALGPRGATEWPTAIPDSLRERLHRATALAVGPGMGRGDDAAAFLAALLELAERPPAVIDADALVLLSRRRELLAKLGPDDVLTPHPGEAAALLGTESAHIQADRAAALATLCGLSAAAVVLKGAGTLVGQAGAPVFISPYAVPALAMGGSGDVLAGCISALLAQNRGQEGAGLRAAATGVVLHALAGRSLSLRYPRRGCLASELADALPHVSASLGQAPQGGWECRAPWPC